MGRSWGQYRIHQGIPQGSKAAAASLSCGENWRILLDKAPQGNNSFMWGVFSLPGIEYLFGLDDLLKIYSGLKIY
jgi:hypothetical protein